MPRKDAIEKDHDIALAAYWRVACPDLGLSDLSTMTGVNRNTLGRRLEEAERREWIAGDWIFKQMPDQLWAVLAQATHGHLQEEMMRHYGARNLPELIVVPAWPPKTATARSPVEEGEIDEINMRMVAHRAAQIFMKRLPQMTVIGMSYGRTLREMVDMLEHYGTAAKRPASDAPDSGGISDIRRRIVTIIGSLSFDFSDPRHSEWLECSASHLANRLARILGIKEWQRFFLETPVYVPPAFLDEFSAKEPSEVELREIHQKINETEALRIAKAFVKAIPTYRDVFVKGKDSAIEQLDTVITSVGDLDTGFGSLPERAAAPLLRKGEFEALRKEAVGDIAGRYLTAEGMTGKPGSTIANVNDRIFGLTIEDLERIAERAAQNGTPGVIVIASSKKKARVISALLKRPNKVISVLIISGDLAEELVPQESAAKKSTAKKSSRRSMP
jgi:DNA-binding transcriptional regulator LsrR (DeoR family)